MIKTIEKQCIDAKNDIWDYVYMEVGNRREPPLLDVVKFDVTHKVLKEKIEERTILINGVPQIRDVRFFTFEIFKVEEIIYKSATFYQYLSDVKPEHYDNVMLQEIVRVNTRIWTGQEIQKVRYWNLGISDCVILTPQQVAELMTPKLVELVDPAEG